MQPYANPSEAMSVQHTVMVYLPTNLIEMIPWVIIGLLLLIALLLFFFLLVHRRNNLRRFAELEEKILFFHPTTDNLKHSHPDLSSLISELNRLKEKVEKLQKMQSEHQPTPHADKAALEKIEVFKKGIHQHLNELHERIKQNEININRMLHYLEDLRETLSQTEE